MVGFGLPLQTQTQSISGPPPRITQWGWPISNPRTSRLETGPLTTELREHSGGWR